jgi:hypothetical protein
MPAPPYLVVPRADPENEQHIWGKKGVFVFEKRKEEVRIADCRLMNEKRGIVSRNNGGTIPGREGRVEWSPKGNWLEASDGQGETRQQAE